MTPNLHPRLAARDVVTTASPSERRGSLPRICLLTETYYPVVGGGEKQAQALAHDLAANGFAVMVMARRSSVDLPHSDRVDGIPVHRIPPSGPGPARRWLMLAASFIGLVRFRRRYDVIFVSGFKALGISAVVVARVFGKRCVLKADSNGEMSGQFFASGLEALRMTPASPPFRLFLAARNRILRRADLFVAITSGIAAEVRQAGVESTRIRSISNGVDTTRFLPASSARKRLLRRDLGMPDGEITIAYTGRLVSYKGLPQLLNVAEVICREHQNVGFVLIGSGGLDLHNCEAALRDYVTAHGLDASVRFAGEVPNVHEFLQASDIFVFPTRDDAFPLALVEAMACGLPVVSTPVGGIGEIVTHERDGLLIEPDDARQLRDALHRLITDPALAARLGTAAVATVRDRYSRTAVSRKYAALFERLIA